MEDVTFGIYVPSYKRSDTILTNDLLEYCTYVVRKSEEEAYRKAGVDNLIAVDDSLIDSEINVTNWIIDNSPEEVICVLDDDFEDILYRLDYNEPLKKDKEVITSELERIAQLLVDLDLGFACEDASSVPYNYTQEFTFKGISGGIKWFNKAKFRAVIDKSVEHNYDTDIILQELMMNRIILMPKYITGRSKICTNEGGSAVGRLRKDMLGSIERMKNKWGKYYKFDEKHNKSSLSVQR